MAEVQVLHKRIESLETAASVDDLARLLNHEEMERVLRDLPKGDYCLVLLAVSGLRLSEVRYGSGVAVELAGAFAKRLRQFLPPEMQVSRWSQETFVILANLPQPEGLNMAKSLAQQVSGAYACALTAGKTVRPQLHVRTTVIDASDARPERWLRRVAEFLPALTVVTSASEGPHQSPEP